jgi:acyl-coenzyme A synthetase/AMP-(fatty) acid ligase
MCKIRGYRVEPGEIEAALARHPSVESAAVLVLERRAGGESELACAVATRSGLPIDRAELRAFLARELPSYMLPDRVCVLGELPRTVTGKIDYRAVAEAVSEGV